MFEGNLSIEENVLALEPRRRAQLAATLIQSLEAADVDAIEAEELEALWLAEIEDRIARVESGQSQSIPWSKVKQRLLNRDK
ncbi:MAG: addiction module protein [Thermoanaerobaculales bacterium]|nr:addiction module protein [Thermoanaerobaculales bacterium]